jgi:hypothetical protein
MYNCTVALLNLNSMPKGLEAASACQGRRHGEKCDLQWVQRAPGSCPPPRVSLFIQWGTWAGVALVPPRVHADVRRAAVTEALRSKCEQHRLNSALLSAWNGRR